MRFFRESCRPLCLPLAMLIVLASVPITTVQAALITTDQVISDPAAASAANLEKVSRFLQQDHVRDQLADMGVNPTEVQARLAALSPAELAQLSNRIDQMPAGQSVGVVVSAILIIFLVLLVTDLLGMTDVFPFVKKHR